MDWTLIWTALTAITPVVVAVCGIFAFIRNNDMTTLTARLDNIDNEVQAKLNEAEFRRHEVREDEQFKVIREGSDSKFEKINDKLDALMKFLMQK